MRLPILSLLSITVIAILTGCTKPTPTLVLDDWWNEDYAKEACRLMQDKSSTCEQDQVRDVRIFELELTTQFAAQPECGGIKVARFSSPTEANKAAVNTMKETYFSLSLNYTPGARKQQWQMVDSPNNNAVTQGKGEPTEIAKSVCAIVNGRGATLLKNGA